MKGGEMEDQRNSNKEYEELKRIGQEANETVRNFSIQLMSKAERNFDKIESLKERVNQR